MILPLRSAFHPTAALMTGALLTMAGVAMPAGALAAPPSETEASTPSASDPVPTAARFPPGQGPGQGHGQAGAAPPDQPSPRMAVSPQEIIVTPSFLPSREELAHYHDEQYQQLKPRYEPDPPPKTRSSTLLGDVNVAPASTRGPSDLVNCPDIAECTPWGKPK